MRWPRVRSPAAPSSLSFPASTRLSWPVTMSHSGVLTLGAGARHCVRRGGGIRTRDAHCVGRPRRVCGPETTTSVSANCNNNDNNNNIIINNTNPNNNNNNNNNNNDNNNSNSNHNVHTPK
mmetsp:Transcript_48110/g.80922  ORF Transcript_48110/g.80922 Transcript_48110/m.80922 type:complete len:121 (+) Transcript_48110:979-1341(+)